MLDGLKMGVEGQVENIKAAESMNITLQRVLVKCHEKEDGLIASLALREVEVKELEETVAALLKALNDVENTAVDNCKVRDRRIAELEVLDRERVSLTMELEAREQHY
jgi:hypothetical protein